MKNEIESPVSSTAVTPTFLDPPRSSAIYVKHDRGELAAKLFAMSVDLEEVLARKKDSFRAEINRFIDEVNDKKRQVIFRARDISLAVKEDEKVGGFYNFILGLFGYERRRRQTRTVAARQLATRDIAVEIDKFLAAARKDFEKQILTIFDIDSVVREFTQMAAGQLYYDEFAILKVAIRRSLSKISVRPWNVKFDPAGPHDILRDDAQIDAALESARTSFDRICNAIISKAGSARRRFEEDIEAVLGGLNEELINACLARKQMEQILQAALSQPTDYPMDNLVRSPYLTGAGSKVVFPVAAEDLRRALLGRPS